MKKILIVEDESLVAMDLSAILTSSGYAVAGIASNFDDAIALEAQTKPDLVLMDIYLKDSKDGISVATQIKSHHDVPIIYITALNSEEDINRAIMTNPSAYLVKPFDIGALKAAIEIAFLNAHTEEQKGDIGLDHEFRFDSKLHQLYYRGGFVKLTKKESELLVLLMESANQVVSLYDIENHIWPEKDYNVNTLRALVSRLRAKLKYKFIETLPAIGYRIVLVD
ncbi:response regulator [Sulfurospirillum sp. 1612]|uniref:response regulator n=1 Tax=Sulfurospirillum sp. 1612 TaxID=3094835 RepID=UPI002F921118